MSDPKFPQHEKLHAVKEKSQACGEFLEWLRHEKNFSICVRHEHLPACCGKERFLGCGFAKDQMEPVLVNTERLLSEFFKINLDRLHKEKDRMVKEIGGK